MRRCKQYRWMPARAAMAAMIVITLGATMAAAAYDDDQGSQQSWQQQQSQDQQQGSMQGQGSSQQQRSQGSGMQGRNQQLERQVADQLRQEGFGRDGQIMILATGNRVILLGLVPDQNQKQHAEQVVNQISNVQQVDNRLQVRRGTGRQNDSQMQQTIQQQLRSRTGAGQDIQVQARSGNVTLSGQVDNWQEMADVLEAAFAAGARNVTSQLTTSGQSQYGMGQTDRGFPSRSSQDQWRGQQYGDQNTYDQEGTASMDRRYGRSDTGAYGQGQSWQQTDQSSQYGQTGQYGQYGRDSSSAGQFGQQGQFSQMSQIQRRLESQLRNQVRGGENLSVLVAGNEAYLFGRVQDDQTKQQAEQVVRNTAGISQIENKIIVSRQGWERRDDTAIENEIQSEMRWSPFVNTDQVQVRVSNGIATLNGRVDSPDAAAAIIQNAFEGGARSVQNQLQISGQMTARDREPSTDRGYYPPYGYTPGQDDQSRWQEQGRQGRMGGGQSQPWMGRSQQGWQPQQFNSNDLVLAHQIALRLQQQMSLPLGVHIMDPQAIYVEVTQGTVKLHGDVQDQNQKQQAERIARSVRGVQNIQNELKVAGESGNYQTFGYVPGQDDQGQSQSSDYPQGQTRDGQTRTQRDNPSSDQTSWQNDDEQSEMDMDMDMDSDQGDQSWNRTQRNTQSQDQSTYGSQTQSSRERSTRGQSAQSRMQQGQQDTWSDTSASGRQQQGMMGGQAGPSDILLSHQIALQLQQQFSNQKVYSMDPRAVYVHVTQGTVMLHGSVQDNNQKQQAEQIIRSIRGVQNVQDELQVSSGQPWQAMGQQQSPQGPQAQPGQMSASDQKLAQQVKQQIQSQLSGANIDVTVSQGTATLQGSVQDNSQKQKAEQIARSVSGIQNIRNSVTVGGRAGDYPALGYIPGQEDRSTQQGATQQGILPQDTGTGISGDTQCIQMFKQGLTNQNLQNIAQNIYVTCRGGKMALYGYVKSDDEKSQLEKATKQVSGVKEVDNNLIVHKEGWKQKSDAEIKEDVESQLWWSPYVDSDKITVSVQNGVVTLSGQANDWDAMRAAVKNAFDGGAKRVRSQIQYSQSGDQTGTGSPTSGATSGRSGQQPGATGQSTTNPSSGAGTPTDRP